MFLLFSVRVTERPRVWKRVIRLSFVNVCQFVCMLLSLLVLRVGCGILLYELLISACILLWI